MRLTSWTNDHRRLGAYEMCANWWNTNALRQEWSNSMKLNVILAKKVFRIFRMKKLSLLFYVILWFQIGTLFILKGAIPNQCTCLRLFTLLLQLTSMNSYFLTFKYDLKTSLSFCKYTVSDSCFLIQLFESSAWKTYNQLNE